MAIQNKYIREWQRILLDTSIIFNLFNSENNNISDNTILFSRTLIDYLNNSNAENNKERMFLISSITLSETLTNESGGDKIKRILKVLNSKNVEIIPFDEACALRFNALLYPHLSKQSLHNFAQEFGFKTNDYMLAREWITKDFMIIVSGIENGADVILTCDKRTFFPLTQKAGQACALVYEELFETQGSFVTKYYNDKVDEFLKK